MVGCRRRVEIELAGGGHVLLQGEDSGPQEEGRGGELKKWSKKDKEPTFVAHSFTFKSPFGPIKKKTHGEGCECVSV